MKQYLSCITELEVRYVNNSMVRASYLSNDIEVCKEYKDFKLSNARLLAADGTFVGNMEELYLTNDTNHRVDGTVEFHCVPG